MAYVFLPARIGGGEGEKRGRSVDETTLPPFSCTATPGFVEVLADLNCALALSTYQAGKVVFIGRDGDRLTQLPRQFDKPMGLACASGRLAVATRGETVVLADAPMLADAYAGRSGVYDALYVPRASYFTGEVDLHDMAWIGDALWGVVTRFSCLARIDDRHSFVPAWKPPFVSALTPDDRCHLNGMAVAGGAVRYVTALGRSDTPFGWRPGKATGGVLLRCPDGEPVLDGLCMPHSPRLIDGALYLLDSGTGRLLRVDAAAGSADTVAELPGFARGLAALGRILFVGLSRLRDRRSFGNLPLEARAGSLLCGVAAVDRLSGRIVGVLRYLNACEEIYDVAVLPGCRRPALMGVADDGHRAALALPGQAFWSETADGAIS